MFQIPVSGMLKMNLIVINNYNFVLEQVVFQKLFEFLIFFFANKNLPQFKTFLLQILEKGDLEEGN